jgi:peptide/nickel transport system permease protein
MIPILTNIGLRCRHLRRLVPDRGLLLDPGLGREVLLAVNRSDYPGDPGRHVYLAMLTMLINLATDLLYKVVDPRVVLK